MTDAEKLQGLMDAVKAAEEALRAEVRRRWPAGSRVSFKWGKGRRNGIVKDSCDAANPLSILVEMPWRKPRPVKTPVHNVHWLPVLARDVKVLEFPIKT